MNSTVFRTAILAGLAALALAGAGAAPMRSSSLRVMSTADHDLFVRAYDAVAHGDWVGARALAARGQNPLARQLLEWRYAREAAAASFEEIDAVLKSSAGWPGRGALNARAEQALPPEMSGSDVIAWFGARPPSTSYGKVRLGEALIDAGQTGRGRTMVREGWVGGNFDPATELAIVQKDGGILSPADDRARLDNLIWRGDITAAKRELARVSGSTVAAAARIALAAGLKGATAALKAAAQSSDPALLFDWASALRRAGKDEEAHAMLLRVPAAAMLREHAARWWTEHNIQARDALTAGDTAMALRLVNHAALTRGDDYSEAQFLGGFIQLRFLKDARAALPLFRRMEAAVGRPISKAKAEYWQGRALDALGDAAGALMQYRLAAAHPETFYGQLALAKTGAPLHLDDAAIEAAPESELESDPLMAPIRVLAELGQEADLRLFIDADATANPSPRHLKRLMMALSEWGYPEIAVRQAKTLGYGGALVLAYSHPVIALPAFSGAGTAPPPALVLGLIRQETEFDPYAVSPAGAEGLMQVMPANVNAQSKAAGLPARRDALLTDPGYNMQLGMSEFAGYLARYNGSVVLAIAAYNAGPSNAARWIKALGDPRLAGVDPIDWIERVPFPETRNYEQRVLENTGAYRARLAGKDVPVQILSDLYAPGAPPSATGP